MTTAMPGPWVDYSTPDRMKWRAKLSVRELRRIAKLLGCSVRQF